MIKGNEAILRKDLNPSANSPDGESMPLQGFRSLAAPLTAWLLAVFLFVTFVGWHQLADITFIHDKAAEIDQTNRQAHRLHALEMGIQKMVASASNFMITGSSQYTSDFRAFEKKVRALIGILRSDGIDMHDVERSVESMHRTAETLFALPTTTGNMQGPVLIKQLNAQLDRLAKPMSARHRTMDASVNRSMQMVSDMHLDMREDFIFSLLGLFTLLLGLTVYLYLRVVKPLIALRHEVARIGEGYLSPTCPDFGANEIGDLSRALNAMGKAIQQRSRELAEARSLAAHQEKMHALGLLAAGIAHEIGNPLSAASISIEVARRKLDQGNSMAAREYLVATAHELARMENIVTNILDFGRSSDAERAIINLGEVIDSAMRLVRLSRNGKSVDFDSLLPANLPTVHGSADMLKQVLVNLLLNAIDASKPGKTVRINATAGRDCVSLDIQDQGVGIPAELQQQIFSPLFTTKPRGRGTGLGLSISRDLMRRMHGDLELVSSGAGGSLFRLSLPLS